MAANLDCSAKTGSDAWRPLSVSCINMRKAAGEINRECLRLPRSAVPETCRMAIDIGGSLAKVAYIDIGKDEDENEAQVNLVTFDIEHLEQCFTFVRETVLASNEIGHFSLKTTGVGSHKYRDKIMDMLGIGVLVDDREMELILAGLSVMWRFLNKEDLLHPSSDTAGMVFRKPLTEANLLPCVIVNVGSAMTVSLVSKDGQQQGIVGSSTFAGLSFLGLGILLTKANNFKDLVELAEDGDHCNVDLLVKDTAGGTLNYNHSHPDGMVSSFGKAAKYKGSSVKAGFRDADIASSILYAVTDNLALQSYYIAQSQHVHRICFCGTYLSGNSSIITQMKQKHEGMSSYLKNDMQSIFMRHEGYLGVIGLLFDENVQPTTNGDHSC